jgi:hypothetical protein
MRRDAGLWRRTGRDRLTPSQSLELRKLAVSPRVISAVPLSAKVRIAATGWLTSWATL